MVEEYRGNQYDDDLTVGLDDVGDESFDTGYVDLFEYTSEEESPISRLKTIMLSIEWEITDDVLIDFNNELASAEQIWVDDPVKLVYIQALQKISRYIYQKKSDAHHNTIKVLMAFFYDLEKIVLDTAISEEEKRDILLEDVKKFERLKQQIGLGGVQPEVAVAGKDDADLSESRAASLESGSTNPELYNLKAYILSIDWEITDKELTEISKEVKKLQSKWSSSKAHIMLLQGIDALGGYIKLMKSQSHGEAFKLLSSFFLALETVVDGKPNYEYTKKLLLSEAEKFNHFKAEIAASITPEAIAEYKTRVVTTTEEPEVATGAESFEGELGFQDTSEFEQTAVVEDLALDEDFSEETLEKVTTFFGDLEGDAGDAIALLSAEEALQGVNVETEADDDSDEDELPVLGDGMLAPALVGLEDDEPEGTDESPAAPMDSIQGVDVETEADDESGENPLPLAEGDLAPALFAGDDDIDGFETESDDRSGDINRHVDDFFSENIFGDEEGEDSEEPAEETFVPALSGLDGDVDEDADEAAISNDIEGRLDSILTEDSDTADEPVLDDEQFAALKESVEGLKTEVNDTNIASIRSEIEKIKERLANRPIEKTLAQFVSTVVQNIDTAAEESDDEAVDLLGSIFDNLEQIRSSKVDQHRALELLSRETEKILEWQQNRLSR